MNGLRSLRPWLRESGNRKFFRKIIPWSQLNSVEFYGYAQIQWSGSCRFDRFHRALSCYEWAPGHNSPGRREVGSDLTLAVTKNSIYHKIQTERDLTIESIEGQSECGKYFEREIAGGVLEYYPPWVMMLWNTLGSMDYHQGTSHSNPALSIDSRLWQSK